MRIQILKTNKLNVLKNSLENLEEYLILIFKDEGNTAHEELLTEYNQPNFERLKVFFTTITVEKEDFEFFLKLGFSLFIIY